MSATFRYIAPDAEREPGTVTITRDGDRVLVHLWPEGACSCALGEPALVAGEEITLRREGSAWWLQSHVDGRAATVTDVPEPAPWEAP